MLRIVRKNPPPPKRPRLKPVETYGIPMLVGDGRILYDLKEAK